MIIGLFIFTNDLRIQDNVGLRDACSRCDKLYTCYVNQTNAINKHATRFMFDCVDELARDIDSVGGELIMAKYTDLKHLTKTLNIDSVFFNNNHAKLSHMFGESPYNDAYLFKPGSVLTLGGTVFKKFTPFYDQVLHLSIESPVYIRNFDMLARHSKSRKSDSRNAGRTLGVKLLKNTIKTQKDYAKLHNMLTYETSHLSAHINFGTISIREVYSVFNKLDKEILRQLIWRDFYGHVLYAYPQERPNMRWSGSPEHYTLWCKGKTGVPVVDACMRQLNETGYMHNRGRLIVASFLVKTLLIDWHLGEQYFAKQLVDYDLASNRGNWQWVAGIGVDSMPYFRIMNPWTQSEKFDPDAVYIKRWVPELETVDADDIHDPSIMNPIVDFKKQSKKFLDLYE